MTDDFYLKAAQKRALEIDADVQEIVSGLARCRAIDDEHTASGLMDGLAEARNRRRMLDQEVADYMRQANPPAQAPMTDQEFMALSPERMANNPQAVEAVFAKSKYYSKDMWNDPEVQQRVRLGMERVNQLRKDGR
jgi:hypothetical protein